MFGNALGHFKHVDRRTAVEDFGKLFIRVDVALVFGVLQTVFFDVVPKAFGHLGSGHGAVANNSSELFTDLDRGHESSRFLFSSHKMYSLSSYSFPSCCLTSLPKGET